MFDRGVYSAWIGAESVNGSYTYINGGPVPMDLWMIGEPDLLNGACVYLLKLEKKLKTADCDNPLPFVCEIKAN